MNSMLMSALANYGPAAAWALCKNYHNRYSITGRKEAIFASNWFQVVSQKWDLVAGLRKMSQSKPP
jgi:hypothetical protein